MSKHSLVGEQASVPFTDYMSLAFHLSLEAGEMGKVGKQGLYRVKENINVVLRGRGIMVL